MLETEMGRGAITKGEMERELKAIALRINALQKRVETELSPKHFVFFEADGTLCVMSGDCNGGGYERQKFIVAEAGEYCRLGAGAW